jgi:YHS domain-containing protein
MSTYVSRGRLHHAAAALCLVLGLAPMARAQTAPPAEPHDHAQMPAAASGDQPAHEMGSMAREGSGTSWLPDITPMYAFHGQKGAWQLMGHENLFVQYLHESGDRGSDQAGSINWAMGMATRPLGAGRLGLRGMFSLEPWTIGGCGYPDLLATGESCGGEKIHDRQHPHDLAMELSASYDAPVRPGLRWQLYAAPAGEPALGPVAFPHRVSAIANPLAPISHHWLDATHITFGVVTGALYGDRWKTELSAFNGREPDERRTDLDLARLDSVSGRVTFMPTPNIALQFSSGRLTEAEPSETGGRGVDVARLTASATFHRQLAREGLWASTVAWGRNSESDHATHAMLLESSVSLAERHTWFARFELVGKTAHDLDLDLDGDGDVAVAKLQGGYTRYFDAWNGFQPGVGVVVSSALVPRSLVPAYGSRSNAGFGLFVTVRPRAVVHAPPSAPASGAPPVDHSQHVMPAGSAAAPIDHSEHAAPAPAAPPSPAVAAPAPAPRPPANNPPRLPVAELERVVDPRCAATIDMINAPRAAHEGKVYYFCSEADRDAFVKDPTAYLNKRAN